MQGICDHRRRFTYLSANTVGPTHDSTAFATTNVSRELAAGMLPAAFHFVGDEAYSGCAEQVVTPYPGRNLRFTNPEQDAFNYWLSNSRTEIECAFGAALLSPVPAAGPLREQRVFAMTCLLQACWLGAGASFGSTWPRMSTMSP